MKTVVVLLNGSEEARASLHHGAKEAVLRGGTLRLVSTWDVPSSILGSGAADEDLYDDFRASAQELIDEAVDYARGIEPDVRIETKVVKGQQTQVLLEESKTADLVVMARGSHGPLKELVVGSITRYMLSHAFCPILVVRTRYVESEPQKKKKNGK